jgi:hypothetical protein
MKEIVIFVNIDNGRLWSATLKKLDPETKVKVIEFNQDTGHINYRPIFVDGEYVDGMAVIADANDNHTIPSRVAPVLCQECLAIIKKCQKEHMK